jgi:hypothetical protein
MAMAGWIVALMACDVEVGESRLIEPDRPAATPAPDTAAPDPAANEGTGPPPGVRPHMDHSPRHGGIVLMQGDHHMELVADRSGAVRLYFSDAFRRPIPAARASGVVRFKSGDDVSAVPLSADPLGEALVGRGPAFGPGEALVTPDIRIDGVAWRIEVPFRFDGTGAPAGGHAGHGDHAGHAH